ncbi:hypothetical protein [Natrarchaeobius oligotrophus]|uniref:DUF7998 domain-containing protein n=1 Tax=Natrarchaeobius chitinivorans TaxID=1679083 RepID=A0A3N6M8S2_NATCH|nr:hypothetical protein [Natrarchaeobius chitinivorans]RQH00114.1 hypothetical protein EA472_12075 [Natrarchaeobius chitinivorans]
MNPFSRSRSANDDSTGFDPWDEFVSDTLPEPGPFLADHRVLVDDAHVGFHRLTRGLFERRGVYDATFGYNLATLNLDRRHPGAGFRYAIDADDPDVLRAEFTPTTEFCPQADALVTGSFRAWNGLSDRHEYEVVLVRIHPSHHQATLLNDSLAGLERGLRETGRVPGEDEGGSNAGTSASSNAAVESTPSSSVDVSSEPEDAAPF